MPNLKSGLCWASAMLLLAAGNALGWVDDKTANVLFVVLPVVAITTLRGRSRCVLPGTAR
ncbi:MAG: hypothetical protein JSR96_07645 [Proteobacteria bacterium]|nr:hypothetical protein [Pseudomonadota bacterium]